MTKSKKSFFDRLTGNVGVDQEEEKEEGQIVESDGEKELKEEEEWLDEEGGQLTVDMFQTPSEIVIKSIVAGVKPEELDVSITQDMVVIKGSRQKTREVSEKSYYYKELYWGSFSRSILLPQEVDTEKAEASIKNGLLVIKLPKVDKDKTQKLKVKVD